MADIFRDEWERKAHDAICIFKYGAVGGSVATADVRRVADYLRGGSYRPPVVMPPLPVAVVCAAFKVPLPPKVI